MGLLKKSYSHSRGLLFQFLYKIKTDSITYSVGTYCTLLYGCESIKWLWTNHVAEKIGELGQWEFQTQIAELLLRTVEKLVSPPTSGQMCHSLEFLNFTDRPMILKM
jgi:hypothetical protein